MKMLNAARVKTTGIMRQNWPVLLAPLLLLGPMLARGEVLFWGTPSLQFVPWWTQVVRSLQQGSLPLWNPNNGMGAPLIANYQLAFFYPPNWLLVPAGWLAGPAGIALGFTILAVVHLVWAGLGMARLVKRLSFGWLAQMVSGIMFGLAGYIIGRLGFFSMVWAAAWIPWVIYYADTLAPFSSHAEGDHRAGDNRPAFTIPAGLVICLSLQLLAGHAQLAWYTILLAGMWVLAASLFIKSWKLTGLNLARLGAALALAAGICAVQLLPTYEYLDQSQRADAYAYQEAMTYSFWPWRAITLLSPDFFGSPADGSYWGFASYWEDHLYMGVIPILLAFSTLLLLVKCLSPSRRGPRSGLIVFGWLVVFTSFLLGMGSNTPIFPYLYRQIPTFDMFQAPTRFLIWASFLFPLLAAVGIENWHCPTRRGLYWFRLATAGAFAVSLGAGLAWLLVENIRLTFIKSTAITGVWAFAFGLLTLAIPLTNSPNRRRAWQACVILLCLIDVVSAGWSLNPGVALRFYSTPGENASVLNNGERVYLSPKTEYDLKFRRFLRFQDFRPLENWQRMRDVILPNLNLLDGLPMVNNFDPLVSQRFQRWSSELDRLSPKAREAWLAFSNTGWIVRINVSQTTGVEFREIDASGEWAWFACTVSTDGLESSWKVLQAEMQSGPTAGRRMVLEGQAAADAAGCDTHKPASVQMVKKRPGQVRFDVYSENPGWLQIKESWHPGWQAVVSGTPSQVYPSDFLFMAVHIPAGKQTVSFIYRPPGYEFGKLFSILILLCGMFFLVRKRFLPIKR